ncbi:hypothetical protein AB0M02_38920 [Actinoplanes sp. NPDC051861]|uniref:hypothetical protein n=1 Tax=Actinoplanes sp. NPDC051861 TaxID=3155170 RepID=UPI00341F251D
MRFLANSRAADGVTREQLVRFFDENHFSTTAWDLIRHRVVTEYALKEGDPPGVVFFLVADSLGEAAGIVNELPVVKLGLLTFEIDPIGKTMHLVPGT